MESVSSESEDFLTTIVHILDTMRMNRVMLFAPFKVGITIIQHIIIIGRDEKRWLSCTTSTELGMAWRH